MQPILIVFASLAILAGFVAFSVIVCEGDVGDGAGDDGWVDPDERPSYVPRDAYASRAQVADWCGRNQAWGERGAW